MQRFGRQCIPVGIKPPAEFGSQVLGISSAATITTEQNFVAIFKSFYNDSYTIFNRFQQSLILQNILLHLHRSSDYIFYLFHFFQFKCSMWLSHAV